MLLLSNIAFSKSNLRNIFCSKPLIRTTQTTYPVGYDLSLRIYRIVFEEGATTNENNPLYINFIYPNGDTTSSTEWTGADEQTLSVRNDLALADSGWYYVRFRQSGCATRFDSINISIGQSRPVIQSISSTDKVTLTVDSLSNKDRTHLLTLTFNQNHNFRYFYIITTEYKLCPGEFSVGDTAYAFGSTTLASPNTSYTYTYSRTNQSHSGKLLYKVLLFDSINNTQAFANTPQGINGDLTVTHNTAYMLPMKITPDTTLNYDKKVKINIHSEWKNLSDWFYPPIPSGQIYATSSNNVGRWELWECNSSGQLLYPATQDGTPIAKNYFQNNIFIAPGPQGNYGSDKLWSTPTIEVYQPCVKYYKIKSVEVYDSCNIAFSDLLTVTFTTKACSTSAISVINSTRANFEYRFNTVSNCPIRGWEARFYKCNNGNGLLASNSSLSQIQVATLPLAKVQYKNVETETLTSKRIFLTQQEINQGFFQRKAASKLIYGNSWYRIDIVCEGCNSVTKTRTIYTYVTN